MIGTMLWWNSYFGLAPVYRVSGERSCRSEKIYKSGSSLGTSESFLEVQMLWPPAQGGSHSWVYLYIWPMINLMVIEIPPSRISGYLCRLLVGLHNWYLVAYFWVTLRVHGLPSVPQTVYFSTDYSKRIDPLWEKVLFQVQTGEFLLLFQWLTSGSSHSTDGQ